MLYLLGCSITHFFYLNSSNLVIVNIFGQTSVGTKKMRPLGAKLSLGHQFSVLAQSKVISLSLYPFSLYPYPFIPFPLYLSFYPKSLYPHPFYLYLFIPICLSLSLNSFPFIPIPFIPNSFFPIPMQILWTP